MADSQEVPDVDQQDIFTSRPKSKQITHYWDLITKYFQSEYQSVSYINETFTEDADGKAISKEEKALTWLILILNEDQLLYYCFHSIFKTGTFLSYYDSTNSFLFNDRAVILEISRKIYANKVYIDSEITIQYKEYLKQSL